jgi:hypothetical protein
MRPKNRTGTVRVILSLDSTTSDLLERIARLGIFGKNKAEVGASILRDWIWDNQDRLAQQGVKLTADKEGSS